MADGYIQIAPDSTGKKVDNAELTRKDGTVVERQRVVLSDDIDPTQQMQARDGRVYVRDPEHLALLTELLNEIRELKELLLGKLF